jgi:hypothetical protein
LGFSSLDNDFGKDDADWQPPTATRAASIQPVMKGILPAEASRMV